MSSVSDAWRAHVDNCLSAETGDCKAVHVVDLAPTEFLDLTGWSTPPEDQTLEIERMPEWSELPCLHLFEDGTVWGHEGRHRVAAARVAGLTTVPIVVWLFQRQAVEKAHLDDLNAWTAQPQALPLRPWRRLL